MRRVSSMLVLVFLAGCGDFSTTIRPTELTLTVDRAEAQPGQDFEFYYQAQGRSMAGLILDYGDGAVDSLGFQGAVTATGRRSHSYENPGTYIVSGTLEDFLTPAVGAEVVVTVVPGG